MSYIPETDSEKTQPVPREHSLPISENGKPEPEVKVAGPTLTMIEVGDAIGFLLAETARETDSEYFILLENVYWVRYQKAPHGEFTKTRFRSISLFRDQAGMHVAQDTASGQFFPQPSLRGYRPLPLDKKTYAELTGMVDWRTQDELLERVHTLSAEGPGLTIDPVMIPTFSKTTKDVPSGVFRSIMSMISTRQAE